MGQVGGGGRKAVSNRERQRCGNQRDSSNVIICCMSTVCQPLWQAAGIQLWTKEAESPARVERTF